MRRKFAYFAAFLAGSMVYGMEKVADAATPTAAQALQLTPIQKDIDFDTPKAEEIEKSSIKAETIDGSTGWVVRDGSGQLLRRFLDTNSDNKVDQWCYYKNGIEVYRDIDADFNGKVDQYRWLGIAGTRWGLDENEDGRIDTWKMISAEEASAELVAALRGADAGRFSRLLLTKAELEKLGLGTEKASELSKKITAAPQAFSSLASGQKTIGASAEWVHFGASQPGIVPKGTEGSTQDVVVYENAVAVIEDQGKHAQVHVGTLVKVGDVWRLVDVPKLAADGVASNEEGLFFQASLVRRPEVESAPAGAIGEQQQKLIAELENIDKALLSAAAKDQPPLQTRRADVLERLIAASDSAQQRTTWTQQMADTISAAVQNGAFPDGVKRLQSLHEKLTAQESEKELAGYVRFRWLSAAYGQSLQGEGVDFAKVQEQWLKDLEAFVADYPKLPDAAEAMLQLAIAQEFAGKESEADAWYAKIVSGFPNGMLAQKAYGARVRLNSVGKPITLKGMMTNGKPFDLAALRGKVVVIHYWATWCEPCKQDMEILRNLLAKYGSAGLFIVGVNLDSDRQTMAGFLTQAKLPWPQLYEDGGLDSRLANELGILTLPAMLLVDAQGKVANRNIHAAELEAELKKYFK